MKYSYRWLQSHIEDPLPTPDALREAIIFHAFEVEEMTTTDDDTIFDIKVLPDRAGDCLGHYGMAREIAGLLDLNFIESAYTLPVASAEVPVDLQAEGCLRYAAVRIDGVHVAPSPAWLAKKLEAVGQRPVSSVVDATNFILLDMGQPTHAFDADKVRGSIVVRGAIEGETITLLGGDEKTLKEGMMVIADSEKVLAIAGVKGGTAAEVTSQTTSVLLEIASFDASSIRKAARRLGLATDASKRFENGLSPHAVAAARAKLVGLVQLLAAGTVAAAGEQYPHPQIERAVSFTLRDIQRVLGTSIADTSIVKVLDQYGYAYQKAGDFYTLEVPFWRRDITGPHDIAEEIGRVIGYDTIAAVPLATPLPIIPNAQYEKIRAIKTHLSAQGYSEVMNYAFRKKGDIYIAHGPKDKAALRVTLSDGLKESYDMNRLNLPLLGLPEAKIFEVGTVFPASGEEVHVATADKDGVKEWTVDGYAIEEKGATAAIEVSALYGNSGGPHPFKPWSPYPFIARDIAVWVDEAGKAPLQDMVASFAQQHCVRPAVLFDTFSKDGRHSLAYRLVFQSAEKTLTDAEVEAVFQQLVASIAAHPGMTIR